MRQAKQGYHKLHDAICRSADESGGDSKQKKLSDEEMDAIAGKVTEKLQMQFSDNDDDVDVIEEQEENISNATDL